MRGRKRFRLWDPSQAPHMPTVGKLAAVQPNGRIVYQGQVREPHAAEPAGSAAEPHTSDLWQPPRSAPPHSWGVDALDRSPQCWLGDLQLAPFTVAWVRSAAGDGVVVSRWSLIQPMQWGVLGAVCGCRAVCVVRACVVQEDVLADGSSAREAAAWEARTRAEGRVALAEQAVRDQLPVSGLWGWRALVAGWLGRHSDP